MEFKHLLSPMKVGNRVYKNRIVSAPMAFSLIAQNPDARQKCPTGSWKAPPRAATPA